MHTVVQIIVHPDGKRRVEFFENTDGTISFDEERFLDEERAWVLLPSTGRSLSRTSTLDEALKEAKGRISWLADLRA